MPRPLSRRRALALAAAAGATATLARSARAGAELRIGALYNLTGDFASIDVAGANGMLLAARRVNESGGVLGMPVSLLLRDCRSDLTLAASMAAELIAAGVSAMGGFGDSDFALAAGPVAQRAGIPFVTSGATLPSLPQMVGDFFFMACYGDDAQAAAVADFTLDALGARRSWLLRNTDADFTIALAQYFEQRYTSRGGAITLDWELPRDPTLYGPLGRIFTVPYEPPDAIFVSALPSQAGPVTRALRDMYDFRGPILSGDGFDTPDLIEVAAAAANGVYYSTHVAYDDPEPIVQRFVADYQAAFGSAPESAFAALGYDTLNLIANAIRRAGSLDPRAVRDALAATRDFPAVTGTISYAAGRRTPIKPVTIVKVEDGVVRFERKVGGEGLPAYPFSPQNSIRRNG